MIVPLFLLIVALLIKIDTLTVFFRQGAPSGAAFHIFKSRTMVDGAYKMGSRSR